MTLYGGISAPDVPVEHQYSLIMRFFTGAVPEYATMFTPVNHESAYGLVWTTPGRAANRFFRERAPGQARPALSSLDAGKRAWDLAAHTMIIKPLNPEVEPDDDLLLPPDQRPVPDVWVSPPGADANVPPGSAPGVWVPSEPAVPIRGWDPNTTYGPGVPLWHNGRMYISPYATGVPGEAGSTWVEVNPATWEAGTYEGGSFVWHNGELWMAVQTTDGEPGVTGWVKKTPVEYEEGMTYAPGTVVIKDGQMYTTPYPEGEPGRPGSNWILVPKWNKEYAYPPGSVVTQPAPGGGGAGGWVDPDKFQMGYPPGGDILPLFYRGVSADPSTGMIFMVDGNNSYINAAAPDEKWGSWGTIAKINFNGHPDGLSPEGGSDHGYWKLRDAMWLDGYFWIIRQLDNKILKVSVSAVAYPIVGTDPVRYMISGNGTIEAEYDLAGTEPLATLSDGTSIWVLQAGTDIIRVYDTGLGFQFSREAPWGPGDESGMGWDGGTVWVANPAEYSIRQYDATTGEVLRTRGWDADEEPPQSIHRLPGSQWLYVVTATWLFRFQLQEERVEKGILRWTGTKWVCQPVYRWTGSEWVRSVVNRWTGLEWVDAEVPCTPETAP